MNFERIALLGIFQVFIDLVNAFEVERLICIWLIGTATTSSERVAPGIS